MFFNVFKVVGLMDLVFFLLLARVEHEDGKELVTLGALKWRGSSGWAEAPRYAEKAPKIVKPRVSPRAIHQPR
jgi:hypothetical protein